MFHAGKTIKYAAMLVAAILLLAIAPAGANANERLKPGIIPPVDSSVWRSHLKNLMPFGINVTVLKKTESGTMERAAGVRLEFPAENHSFHYALLDEPMPMEYYSFVRGGDTVLHDIVSDSIWLMPTRLSPISVFSLDDSADSFFSSVRIADIEPEVFENQDTYVFKIVSDMIPFSPGQDFRDVDGHLWIDLKAGRPLKIILMGTITSLSGEDEPTSVIIEFFYDGMTLEKEQWQKVDTAISAYLQDDRQKGQRLIREIEKSAAKGFADMRRMK